MEATNEGLLDKIRPPRLEDAGLEDCALPPESIREAFLRAASAVRSIISTSDDEAEDSCVDDPWPSTGDSPDSLVGITEGVDDGPGSCVTENPTGGGVPELAGDKVVVAGAGGNEDKTDALVVPDLPRGGGSCVEGLEGLSIGEKAKKSSKITANSEDDDDPNEDEKTEKPIIVEGYA